MSSGPQRLDDHPVGMKRSKSWRLYRNSVSISTLSSFGIDLPLDCDDEYWFNADTSKAFQQPSGQPSRIGQYIELIKLKLIHARTLRTLVGMILPSSLC
jgi:hypothetical protein